MDRDTPRLLNTITSIEAALDERESIEELRLTLDESSRRKLIAAAALWSLTQGKEDQAELILDSEPFYISEIVRKAAEDFLAGDSSKTDESML